MIVYGDPTRVVAPHAVLARIAHDLREVERAGLSASQARLRGALLLAGELEQAAWDHLPERMPAAAARAQAERLQALTVALADALLAAYAAPHGPQHRDARALLAEIGRALDAAHAVDGEPLPVKTVEGPAFYALYPEQYIEAARAWVAEHETEPGTAAVVGIRSAGTVLGAVVAAAVRATGRRAVLLSVRPGGHPFARTAEIDREALRCARFGLVVDEGPGLSGSSLASVADALERAGLARADISLLPGHDQLPKQFFSEDVRALWHRARRYVAPLDRVRLDGKPLREALVSALWPADAPVQDLAIDDLGGGRWRSVAYGGPHAWPAACAPFERPKLRAVRGGKRLLFVFAGLGCAPDVACGEAERFFARHSQRADLGYAPAPLGVAHGFVALPWLDARPLDRRDLEPALVARIGGYVASVAEPRLAREEQAAALARLREMLFVNVGEALGRDAALRARALCERVLLRDVPRAPPGFGDGRMAPHQWLRTLAGRTLKVGGVCRDHDHTIVGRQAVHWDLAGACVEWGLDPESKRELLAAYAAAAGDVPHPSAMRFYDLAYAAFRLGQVALCASATPEHDPERERLARARAFYAADIERMLLVAR